MGRPAAAYFAWDIIIMHGNYTLQIRACLHTAEAHPMFNATKLTQWPKKAFMPAHPN
jgi:hypothetical protein